MLDKIAIQRPFSMPMAEPYRLLHEYMWYLQRQIYRPYWKQRVSSALAVVGKAGWDIDGTMGRKYSLLHVCPNLSLGTWCKGAFQVELYLKLP